MTTPKEFDYDLWKTTDGKFFIRIKRTGDTCEVDAETFHTLHNEAMAMYREQQGIPIYTVRNGKSTVVGRMPPLHLGYASAEGGTDDAWAEDPSQLEDIYMTTQLEQKLRDCLTPKQLEIYEQCLLGDISYTQFAIENSIHESAVRKSVSLIRKKAKIIFGRGYE